MKFIIVLLAGIIGGFVGGFLYHSVRYGLIEAYKDFKFCITSIVSDICDWIKKEGLNKEKSWEKD